MRRRTGPSIPTGSLHGIRKVSHPASYPSLLERTTSSPAAAAGDTLNPGITKSRRGQVQRRVRRQAKLAGGFASSEMLAERIVIEEDPAPLVAKGDGHDLRFLVTLFAGLLRL